MDEKVTIFYSVINRQSGTIHIVPDLEIKNVFFRNKKIGSVAEKTNKLKLEPHLLHTFSHKSLQNTEIYNSNLIKKTEHRDLNIKLTKLPANKTPSQKFSDMIRQKYKNQLNKSNEKFSQIFSRHSSSYNTGKGHWVTMNGSHVFIEDK